MEPKTPKWILALLVAIPLLLFGLSATQAPSAVSRESESLTVADQVDDYLQKSLPFSNQFRKLGLEFRYRSGETKQKEIYISEKGLLRDIKTPLPAVTKQNNEDVIQLAEALREQDEEITLGVMILPSAPAILQQQLPRFSTPVNQRNQIENIYNQLTGKVTAVNTYSTLFEQREKYLYYRTEDTFTSLGGYYLYQEILRRMLSGEDALKQSDFEISYGPEFRGSLYHQVPYQQIRPDQVMYFHYTGSFRSHHVTHWKEETEENYVSLYPRERRELGWQSVLGGTGGRTEIKSSSTYHLNLLVLGDRSALSYLPFLANHYETITFVDVESNPEQLATLQLEEYDQILIGVFVETYTTQPLFEQLVFQEEET